VGLEGGVEGGGKPLLGWSPEESVLILLWGGRKISQDGKWGFLGIGESLS